MRSGWNLGQYRLSMYLRASMYEKHKGHGRILCLYVMYYVDMSFSHKWVYACLYIYMYVCDLKLLCIKNVSWMKFSSNPVLHPCFDVCITYIYEISLYVCMYENIAVHHPGNVWHGLLHSAARQDAAIPDSVQALHQELHLPHDDVPVRIRVLVQLEVPLTDISNLAVWGIPTVVPGSVIICHDFGDLVGENVDHAVRSEVSVRTDEYSCAIHLQVARSGARVAHRSKLQNSTVC